MLFDLRQPPGNRGFFIEINNQKMKIIAISEIFKLQASFVLPQHPDFHFMPWNQAKSKDCDAYIQTSISSTRKNHHLDKYYNWVKSTGKPYLVMEQAVFRKNVNNDDESKRYYRLGLNSFYYDEGEFNNKNSPPDRWKILQEKLQIEIKPWRNKGDYILLLLQNTTDTSINRITIDYHKWISNTIKEISRRTSEDIVVRVHPRFVHKYNLPYIRSIPVKNNIVITGVASEGYNISHGGKGLQDDLDGARVVVGYNSNGLQEAVCEGIPTISLDKSSFSWPVSYRTFDVLSLPEIKCDFDRTQWLYDCSYCQWTPEELNTGYPHRRLLNSL